MLAVWILWWELGCCSNRAFWLDTRNSMSAAKSTTTATGLLTVCIRLPRRRSNQLFATNMALHQTQSNTNSVSTAWPSKSCCSHVFVTASCRTTVLDVVGITKLVWCGLMLTTSSGWWWCSVTQHDLQCDIANWCFTCLTGWEQR